MQLFLQLSKLQGTTSYFDENVGRVGVKSDTVITKQSVICILCKNVWPKRNTIVYYNSGGPDHMETFGIFPIKL